MACAWMCVRLSLDTILLFGCPHLNVHADFFSFFSGTSCMRCLSKSSVQLSLSSSPDPFFPPGWAISGSLHFRQFSLFSLSPKYAASISTRFSLCLVFRSRWVPCSAVSIISG
ncbi:MAG: hypothetical protein BYD32DRAFT_423838 [Podila humilis]|nr:MAG: hypothetical protein BYD32DRAFT_423838 [Podila humilis]